MDRRQYYSKDENAKVKSDGGHPAKTPLHVARWAIQNYSKRGEWVLDPTAGAGTTLVEALTHGRNAVGVEIEFVDVTRKNLEHVLANQEVCPVAPKYLLIHGDARRLDALLPLKSASFPRQVDLVVNNPPYFGDQSQKAIGGKMYEYSKERANLAHLKEGPDYWVAIESIYRVCVDRLKKGGHFVIGIKDQMRNKKPDMLHEKFGQVLLKLGMTHVGTALLLHYPATLFINTYERNHGVAPPKYQTILVFRKD